MTHYPGMLISVEGIDGSGKSTLVYDLATRLRDQGHTVIQTKEPGGSQLGKELRTILQTQPVPITPVAEYLLFAADRAQHMHDVVKPALENGALVISDRMGDSSLAYQGYGRGINHDMIKTVNTWAMQEIKPDIVLYLKISAKDATQRLNERATLSAFEKEQQDFINRLVDGFETMFHNRNDVITLDATQPPHKVAQKAITALTPWFNKKQMTTQTINP